MPGWLKAIYFARHTAGCVLPSALSDFDPYLSPEACLENILANAQSGSIVVLHDSLKADTKLRFVLPRLLEHFSGLGYRFEALPMQEPVAPSSLEYRAKQIFKEVIS